MSLLDLMLAGALAVCFAGAAVLGAAEVSIVRVRRSSVLLDVRSDPRRTGLLLRMLDELPVVLNAVLLLTLGLQVSAATIAGVLADRWFGGVGVTVATVVLTAALFVYAEAVPKTRAMRSPHVTALRVTPLLRVVVAVLRPAVAGLVWMAGFQAPGEVSATGALSEQEIRILARESAKAGAIGERDADLVARSFEFNDRQVDEIMVDSNDIASVDCRVPARDALALAVTTGHRRLPVHGGDLDHIVGVVRLRDLAAAVTAGLDPVASSLADDVLRCRPDDPISAVLTRMQRNGRWMAIVTDSDGRTVGLITIEDVVAELVGDIEDERAAANPNAGRRSGGAGLPDDDGRNRGVVDEG